MDPKILDGSFTCLADQSLDPEMAIWIQELQQKAMTEITLDIAETDFVRCFKSMKVSKASLPSGRHVGHYIRRQKLKIRY